MTDSTVDPALRSWVPVADDSDFPIQNLPYGIVSRPGEARRVGVAIGDRVLDVAAVAAAGLLDGHVDGARDLAAADTLNPLFARGRPTWTALRRRLSALLAADAHDDERRVLAGHLIAQADVDLHLPAAVGDYVDFYSSLQHATNLGRMLRPDSEPLLPNWRHLPVGYHGRSATLVASGTSIPRPRGQVKGPETPAPELAPTRRLDIELEVGFITGPGNALGHPIATAAAADHVFGIVLVNDWSARDIQAWEYQPLGPFLGKSFATSVSPWVVTLDALAPYRVAGPPQDPPVLDYLRGDEPWHLDLELRVDLRTAEMAAAGEPAVEISAVNARSLYWSIAQQLAHATVNGAVVRPGDLFASGTVSGDEAGSEGSLMELTWRGERLLELPGGATRTFLEDGDSVTLRGWCGGDGRPRVGLGEVAGTVVAAVG